MGVRGARGSPVRAWVVAHDGYPVAATVVAVGAAGSLYASTSVPSFSGGPVPIWFLTPPTLAMFAALAVHDDVGELGWATARLRGARLVWVLAVVALTTASAALVGEHAGQARLPELTAILTGLTFGLAVPVGRASAALGAGCLVVVVVSTHALHSLSPSAVWDRLPAAGRCGVALGAVAGVAVYAYAGSRRGRTTLSG